MARRRQSATSRDSGAARALRWLLLALAGAGGGMMLGELVVGNRPHGVPGDAPSFSGLSANPDAATLPAGGAPPCPDCADSYGVADRLRARPDERMGDAFRELGSVDVDPVPTEPDEDDYRYGGRFPDPGPRDPEPAEETAEQAPTVPATGLPPQSEAPSAGY